MAQQPEDNNPLSGLLEGFRKSMSWAWQAEEEAESPSAEQSLSRPKSKSISWADRVQDQEDADSAPLAPPPAASVDRAPSRTPETQVHPSTAQPTPASTAPGREDGSAPAPRPSQVANFFVRTRTESINASGGAKAQVSPRRPVATLPSTPDSADELSAAPIPVASGGQLFSATLGGEGTDQVAPNTIKDGAKDGAPSASVVARRDTDSRHESPLAAAAESAVSRPPVLSSMSHPTSTQADGIGVAPLGASATPDAQPGREHPVVSIGKLGRVFEEFEAFPSLLPKVLDESIPPPTFLVIGKESAGKSSLLERLTLLPIFPRAESLCTRAVVHVRLRRTPHANAVTASKPLAASAVSLEVLDMKPTGGTVRQPAVAIPFDSSVPLLTLDASGRASAADAEAAAAKVKAAIERALGPHAKAREVCTDKLVQVTIMHPSLPPVDLFDMPGLVGAERTSKAIRDVSTRLIDRYREREGAYFLAVVPNGEAPASDLGMSLLYESDVPYERVIGVFSKADRALGDDPARVPPDFVQANSYPFKDEGRLLQRFGWVVTLNPMSPVGSSLQSTQQRLLAQASAETTWFKTMLRIGTDGAGNLIQPSASLTRRGPVSANDDDDFGDDDMEPGATGALTAAYGCNALVERMDEAHGQYVQDVWAPRMLLLLRGAWRRKRDGGASVVAFRQSDKGKFLEIRGDEAFVDGEEWPVRWLGAHHFDIEGRIVSVDEIKKGDVGIERTEASGESQIVFIGNPVAASGGRDIAGRSELEAESMSLRDLGVAASKELVMQPGDKGAAKRRELRVMATTAAVTAIEAGFTRERTIRGEKLSGGASDAGASGSLPVRRSQKEAISEFLLLGRDPLAPDLHARVATLLDRQKREPNPLDQFAIWSHLQTMAADKVDTAATKFSARVRAALDESDDSFRLWRFPRFLDEVEKECKAYYLSPSAFRGRSLESIIEGVASRVPNEDWVESTASKRAELEAFIRQARTVEERLLGIISGKGVSDVKPALPLVSATADPQRDHALLYTCSSLSAADQHRRDELELADLQARGGASFSAQRIEAQVVAAGKTPPFFKLDELVAAGFPATIMRRAGVKLERLAEAGYSVRALVQANFSVSDIVELGHGEDTGVTFSPDQWEDAGFTCRNLREKGCGLTYLLKCGFELAVLLEAGFTARELRSKGIEATSLASAGASSSALAEAGFTAKQLRETCLFSARELKAAGFTARELKNAGYGVQALREARVPAAKLRSLGFDLATLAEADVPISELREAAFEPQELRRYFSVRSLKDDGEYRADELRSAGFGAKLCYPAFSASQLRRAGFSCRDVREAGCTVDELRSAGFTLRDLRHGGTPLYDLVHSGYTPKQLDAAGVRFDELSRHFRIADMIDNGIEPKGPVGFKGSHAEDLWRAGYNPARLLRAGFREDHLRQIGFESAHFAEDVSNGPNDAGLLGRGAMSSIVDRDRGISVDKIDYRARTISTVVKDSKRIDLLFDVLVAVVKYAPWLLALRLKHELLEASGESTWLDYMRGATYHLPKLRANKAEKGRQRALTRALTEQSELSLSRAAVAIAADDAEITADDAEITTDNAEITADDAEITTDNAEITADSHDTGMKDGAPGAASRDELGNLILQHPEKQGVKTEELQQAKYSRQALSEPLMAPATAEAQGSMTPGQPAHRPLPTAPSTAPTQPPNSATSATATDFANTLSAPPHGAASKRPSSAFAAGFAARGAAKHVPTQPPSLSPPPSPPYSRPPSPPPSPPAPGSGVSQSDTKPKLPHGGRGRLGGAMHKSYKVLTGKKKGSSSDIVDSPGGSGNGDGGSDGGETVADSSTSAAGADAKSAPQAVSSSTLTDGGTSSMPAIHAAKKGSKRGSFIPSSLLPSSATIAAKTTTVAHLSPSSKEDEDGKDGKTQLSTVASTGSASCAGSTSATSSDAAAPVKKRSVLPTRPSLSALGSSLASAGSTLAGSRSKGEKAGNDALGAVSHTSDAIGQSESESEQLMSRIGVAIGRSDFVRALTLIDSGLAINPDDAILRSYRGWVKDLARTPQGAAAAGTAGAGGGAGVSAASPGSPHLPSLANDEIFKWRDATDVRGRATLGQLRSMIENDEIDPFSVWVWNKTTSDADGNSTWVPLMTVIEREDGPEFKGDVDPQRASELMLSLLLFASGRVLLERMATATVSNAVFECMEIVICAMKRRSGESGDGLQALKEMLPLEGQHSTRRRSRSASIVSALRGRARGFVKYRQEVPAADGAIGVMVSTWLQELVDQNPLILGCKWEQTPSPANGTDDSSLDASRGGTSQNVTSDGAVPLSFGSPKNGIPLICPQLVSALSNGRTSFTQSELAELLGAQALKTNHYVCADAADRDGAAATRCYKPVAARSSDNENVTSKLYRPREWLELLIGSLVELSTEMPKVLRNFGYLKPGWLQGNSLLSCVLTLQLTSGNRNSTRGALEDPFVRRTFDEDPWLLTIPAFWTEQTWALFDDTTQTLYPKLHKAPNSFYYQLVVLIIRLMGQDEGFGVAKAVDSMLDSFENGMDDAKMRFLLKMINDVSERCAADPHAFKNFQLADLDKVATAGLKTVSSLGDDVKMEKAKTAMEELLKSYIKDFPPTQWASLFRDAASKAYHLKYMFREDVGEASKQFRAAVKLCPVDAGGGTGGLFDTLVEKALKTYGKKGLVDQDELQRTNFMRNPRELMDLIDPAKFGPGKDKRDPLLRQVADVAVKYMEMTVASSGGVSGDRAEGDSADMDGESEDERDGDERENGRETDVSEQSVTPEAAEPTAKSGGGIALLPHHTQILVMLMLVHFFENKEAWKDQYGALIMQMKTGEGKSIVIAMLAVLMCTKFGKKVHVLENNEGLLERDYATYAPYFARFGLKSAKKIDGESHICYCLKSENNAFFNASLASGQLDLQDTILIVDEVDDLVVNENPSIGYVKADSEKTPDYERCYCALQVDDGLRPDEPPEAPLPSWLATNAKLPANIAQGIGAALMHDGYDSVATLCAGSFTRDDLIDAYKADGDSADAIMKAVERAKIPIALWKECARHKAEALEKRDGHDFQLGESKKIMLEKLPDGSVRTPKVTLTDGWLEFLNFRDHSVPPRKNTYFSWLCTPYMYTAKYGCIFGLTGSIGGGAERAYIKNTYRAVPFEVPQFLQTCPGTGKEPPKNLGVKLVPTHREKLDEIIRLTLEYFRKVPVLVITRGGSELEEVHRRLREELAQPMGVDPWDPRRQWNEIDEHLLVLRERNAKGELQREKWNLVIEQATKRRGTHESSFCCVTVTDLFGGRGHDYSVDDEQAIKNGGMLVLATSMPDEREWTQWKGRTARQDKPGQFYVVMSEDREPFNEGKTGSEYIKEFKRLKAEKAPKGSAGSTTKGVDDVRIDSLHRRKDRHMNDTLERFKSDQAKGAWLNELVEQYYRSSTTGGVPRARDERQEWPLMGSPHEGTDKVLRDLLTDARSLESGKQIKETARKLLALELRGPPKHWGWDEGKSFIQQPSTLPPMAVIFLLDRSYDQFRKTAITAVEKVFSKYLPDGCVVGYRGVGETKPTGEVKPIFEMTEKTTKSTPGMLKLIRESDVRSTAPPTLYCSMEDAISELKKPAYAERSKWLIVLTDLVDLQFKQRTSARQKVDALIAQMSLTQPLQNAGKGPGRGGSRPKGGALLVGQIPMQKFNLALVDTSEMKIKGESIKYQPNNSMWPEWKANARRMVQRLADGGTTSMGYHISADDFQKIDDAFEAVAKLMADNGTAAA